LLRAICKEPILHNHTFRTQQRKETVSTKPRQIDKSQWKELAMAKMLKRFSAGLAFMALTVSSTASTAATTPSSGSSWAALSAMSSASSAQATDDGSRDREGRGYGAIAWPAVGVILAAIILAIVLASSKSHGKGRGFSPN
jgi:hypothetical protein